MGLIYSPFIFFITENQLKIIMTDTKTAFDKKYLEDKVIALKPSPRGASMGITDPKHVAYFQIDQGSTFFCLPRNKRGDLVDVFSSSEERDFFEDQLGLNLNVSKPGNFFEKETIKITKDAKLMHSGEEFKLNDLMDNLRYRIIKACPVVAPSWEKRKNKMEYRWALVDKSLAQKEASIEYDAQQEFWMLMGKYSDAPKMRNLLKVYFSSTNSDKKVPMDMTPDALKKELIAIGNNDKSRDKLLELSKEQFLDMKILTIEALAVKAIVKEGSNSYQFAGESETDTFEGIAKKLSELKKIDDDLYMKIVAQVKQD